MAKNYPPATYIASWGCNSGLQWRPTSMGPTPYIMVACTLSPHHGCFQQPHRRQHIRFSWYLIIFLLTCRIVQVSLKINKAWSIIYKTHQTPLPTSLSFLLVNSQQTQSYLRSSSYHFLLCLEEINYACLLFNMTNRFGRLLGLRNKALLWDDHQVNCCRCSEERSRCRWTKAPPPPTSNR